VKIGLALSGGGIRAMAFHVGVLRYLAERGMMEEVVHVSSVSGGTLLAGLVFSLHEWKWPTSKVFLEQGHAKLRSLITERSLAAVALWRLLYPTSWPYLLSRANILAKAIEKCWGVRSPLSALPTTPMWSINGTTAETGRRFRFKGDRCGDYELGYARASGFSVAQAMAVSAALPGAIGPLVIPTGDLEWFKRPSWNAPESSETRVVPPYERLHIYDGGVYDNLGLEPLVDVGTLSMKGGIDFLVCADAGAPLPRVPLGFTLSPFRAMRILDLALDQSRALRVRMLSQLLKRGWVGIYAQIGANAVDRLNSYQNAAPAAASELLTKDWLSAEGVGAAAAHPTTLFKLSRQEFDRLERHGYESALWNEIFRTEGCCSSGASTGK
jgi:NTE family protein